MEIVQMLMSQLGISEEQATGGSGLLFKMVKDKLGSDDFAKVAGAVPGIENLISSAPESGGVSGLLGGLASSLGGGKMADLADLAGGFKDLKLDPDMIGKFIPVVMSFFQEQGGDSIKNILAKVLK